MSEFRDALLQTIPNLRAFAMSLCGSRDRADDLVQDTLVKAWSNQSSFEPGTNLKAWLFTILRNTFYSNHRKRRRETEDMDEVLSGQLCVHPEQAGHMDLLDMKVALSKLSPDQREALMLVAAEGLSYEEAAEVCGCAIGTVKSRVNRARAQLAQLLEVNSASEFGPDSSFEASITLRTKSSA